MRKTISLGGLACFIACAFSSTVLSEMAVADVIENINIEPSARWRYQDVDDPVLGDTSANTGLVRLSVSADIADTVSFFAQGDHSFAINGPDYSDGVTLRQASFIPDPEVSEFNQLWLEYETEFGATLKLGRQVLESDNERHLGGNGFWQNEQSFDTVSIEYTTLNDVKIRYTYLDRVNRIFGPDADARLADDDIRFGQIAVRPAIERGVHEHSSHLLDVDYALSNTLKLSGFFYSLDNQTFSGFSSHTLGVRLEGSAKPDTVRYLYRVELATQTDAYNSTWDYQAHYLATTLGMQINSHRFEFNYENIGDDGGRGFVHSLGSNHQFQGWADVFDQYQKPEGIADTSIIYRGRHKKLRWRAKFHVFQSADHSIDAGKELDLELAWRATRKWELSAIYAHYMADDGFDSLLASQQDKTTWFLAVKYNL